MLFILGAGPGQWEQKVGLVLHSTYMKGNVKQTWCWSIAHIHQELCKEIQVWQSYWSVERSSPSIMNISNKTAKASLVGITVWQTIILFWKRREEKDFMGDHTRTPNHRAQLHTCTSTIFATSKCPHRTLKAAGNFWPSDYISAYFSQDFKIENIGS